jgi:hypothetical protein
MSCDWTGHELQELRLDTQKLSECRLRELSPQHRAVDNLHVAQVEARADAAAYSLASPLRRITGDGCRREA